MNKGRQFRPELVPEGGSFFERRRWHGHWALEGTQENELVGQTVVHGWQDHQVFRLVVDGDRYAPERPKPLNARRPLS